MKRVILIFLSNIHSRPGYSRLGSSLVKCGKMSLKATLLRQILMELDLTQTEGVDEKFLFIPCFVVYPRSSRETTNKFCTSILDKFEQ